MTTYTQQSIGLGTAPNDDTGDDLRTSFDKLNNNFDEVFGATTHDAAGAKVWINEAGGIAQSQQGIKLGGTAAPNLFNDYEEGTFTPTISADTPGAPTYSVQDGAYQKIGRWVNILLEVAISGGTLPSGNNVTIEGLPFVPDFSSPVFQLFYFNLTGGTNGRIVRAFAGGTPVVNLHEQDSDGRPVNSVTGARLTSTTLILLSGKFRTST